MIVIARAGGEGVRPLRLRGMSAEAVDEYLRALEEPKRSTLRPCVGRSSRSSRTRNR